MSLQNFPYDVLFTISLCLDVDDVVHLSNCCKQLRFLNAEPTLCRRIIESCASFTYEAEEARRRAIDYPTALLRLYRRRRAFSSGIPVKACVVGLGTDFVYSQGVLVFLRDLAIHIVDIRGSGSTCTVPISSFGDGIIPSEGRDSISLLHYSHGVLSLWYKNHVPDTHDLLLVLKISLGSAGETGSCRLATALHLESTVKLFVRNTKDYLFYGTHSAVGSQHHHEWVIRGYSLNEKCRFAEECSLEGNGLHSLGVQLPEFPGADIGSTVAFKIHDGYFYALSNCTSFSVVEIDWTSFYHCIRFPIDNPASAACETNKRLYRRQHSEGPIHDSWTDLSLQVDERTNELKIVETRQEWLDGRNQQSRTFYMRDIKFSTDHASADIAAMRTDLADDRFSRLSTSQSNYAPKQPRQMWQVHPEEANNTADGSDLSSSFILSRTKFRSYNLSTNTFLDLVDDDSCCPSEARTGHRGSCLRLRSGTRKLAPVSPDSGLSKGKERATSTPPSPTEDFPGPIATTIFQYGAASPYNYSSVNLWPPPAYTSAKAARAHRVLHPDISGVGGAYAAGVDVKAVADERSLVFLMRDYAAAATSQRAVVGKIVCLCFDGNAGVQGLPQLYDIESGVDGTDGATILNHEGVIQSSTEGISYEREPSSTPSTEADKKPSMYNDSNPGNDDAWNEETSTCVLDLDDVGWGW